MIATFCQYDVYLMHIVCLVCAIIFRCRELCTLFSFVEIEAAFEKVVVLPLEAGGDIESGGGGGGVVDGGSTTVMQELVSFHIHGAHCYDPNEERKLNTVISAVGVDKFHDKIRTLARFYVEGGRDRSLTV